MKKLAILYFIVLLIYVNVAYAQDNKRDSISQSAKLDSIYLLQKKMYGELRNEPLSGKNYGAEFNPFRLFYMDKFFTISGGFSMFNVSHKIELAFPVYYQKSNANEPLTELTIDCHYRRFLGNTENGFYLSGFARTAYLRGELGENSLLFPSSSSGQWGTEVKFGVGVGIGYRRFSYSGLYWGASFSFGRYLLGKSNRFQSTSAGYDDDNEFILDIELLKFGWAF